MKKEVRVPEYGLSSEEMRLIRWVPDVGDRIERGEAIVEIETDKVTVEVEATDSGVLVEKVVEEGSDVQAWDCIGYLETE